MPISDEEVIRKILLGAKTIALVGASIKPWRDSNKIMKYLLQQGYEVIPVNPKYSEVLGMSCIPSLPEIPEELDIVDVFRRAEAVGPIADDAIALRAKTLWMQLGIVNEKAAGRAEEAGLNVIMDRCIMVEHRRLLR